MSWVLVGVFKLLASRWAVAANTAPLHKTIRQRSKHQLSESRFKGTIRRNVLSPSAICHLRGMYSVAAVMWSARPVVAGFAAAAASCIHRAKLPGSINVIPWQHERLLPPSATCRPSDSTSVSCQRCLFLTSAWNNLLACHLMARGGPLPAAGCRLWTTSPK